MDIREALKNTDGKLLDSEYASEIYHLREFAKTALSVEDCPKDMPCFCDKLYEDDKPCPRCVENRINAQWLAFLAGRLEGLGKFLEDYQKQLCGDCEPENPCKNKDCLTTSIREHFLGKYGK
jgi:hypothetical protein